jgi:hypothetical protein
MVNATAEKYRRDGYEVCVEDENAFTLVWHGIKIRGRPDIVAIKDGHALVVDCKTGASCAFHALQVMLYMLILPFTHPRSRGLTHEGSLLYHSQTAVIPSVSVDVEFKQAVHDLVTQIGGSDPLPLRPSAAECSRCDISRYDCGQRVDVSSDEVTVDDLF